MPHYISTSCPICDSPTSWTVPHRTDGFPKGIIQIECGQCAFNREIFIDVPQPEEPPVIQKREWI